MTRAAWSSFCWTVSRVPEEVLAGQLNGLGPGAAGVVEGDEVPADGEGEGEDAPGLDLVGVGDERAEHGAQEVHPLGVDPAEPVGDGLVVARPGPDGEIDLVDVLGECQLTRAPDPRGRVAAGGLDVLEDLAGAAALPLVEHLVEQCVPAVEVPVETAFGDTELRSQRLDPDGVGSAARQRGQTGFDPAGSWGPGDGGNGSSSIDGS